jgi:hypothetical protein
MLAALNVVILLVWLLAEVIPAAADRLAASEAAEAAELKRRKDRRS